MRPQSVVAPSGDCYDVEAGMALFAGKTVCSMPERIGGFTTRRFMNPRYLLPLPVLTRDGRG